MVPISTAAPPPSDGSLEPASPQIAPPSPDERSVPLSAMLAAESTPLLGKGRRAGHGGADAAAAAGASALVNPPAAPFTKSLPLPIGGSSAGGGGSGRLPQTIAHRGYKAAFPENTMGAFRGAAAIGAHAVETDLHLAADGTVVLSHDGTLKRCFGVEARIRDCAWDYLATLRTVRAPHERMPRLRDLLEMLAERENWAMWTLLDIKMDDPAEDLLKAAADTIKSVPVPEGARPWEERIVFGCWNAKYVHQCQRWVGGFPLTHIGYSLAYARQFFAFPNVSFNLFQKVLVGPLGGRFMRQCREWGRPLLAWTVNDEMWMEWCIRKEVDGVITDDPMLFLEVCRRYGGAGPKVAATPDLKTAAAALAKRRRTTLGRKVWLYTEVVGINMLVMFFATLFWFKYGSPKKRVRKELQEV